MCRSLVRDYEWTILLLSVGDGLVWGVVSLFIGFSWLFVRASGVLRVALIALSLPLHLAFWVGRILQLPVTDPTGLVIATGVVLGLIPGIVFPSVLRWRER
jgi:hypothetical protein